MMRLNVWKAGLALVLVASLCSAEAHAQKPRQISKNLVEVTVVGQGEDKESARTDAWRRAVETGAGVYLHSQSETRDFALVRDTILARSSGFLQKKTILSEKLDEDVWTVKIRAVVSVKGIEDAWGVTTELLQRMGRPKIMILIREKIAEKAVASSTVQTRIENLLHKSGFLLVDSGQIKAIAKKDLEAAMAEDNSAKVQAIAKRFGAQIFITGNANAASQGSKRMGGATWHRYEGEANVRCFRSDTGQLLSSIPGQPTRGVARVWRSAAKMALDSQAKQVAPLVRNDILRFWQDALEGRGEVVLEVSNITKFLQVVKLKRELGKLKTVKSVGGDYHKGVTRLSLNANTRAEKLAEEIAIKMEDKLEVEDISQNVIKAKYIGK